MTGHILRRELLLSGVLIAADGILTVPEHMQINFYFAGTFQNHPVVLDSYDGQAMSLKPGIEGSTVVEHGSGGSTRVDCDNNLLIVEWNNNDSVGRVVYDVANVTSFHVIEIKRVNYGRKPDPEESPPSLSLGGMFPNMFSE